VARRDGRGVRAGCQLDAVSTSPDPCQELEREARRAEMSGDPLAPVLRALVGTATAMDKSMAEIAQQIEQCCRPVSPQVVRQAVSQAIHVAVPDVIRAFTWRTIAVASGAVLVLMVVSFGAGYAAHRNQRMAAGLRAGDDTCRAQDGGVLCYVPIWQTLPSSAVGK
jgi:hypothetical protein